MAAIFLLFTAIFVAIPVGKILSRAGWNGWIALVCLIPLGGLVLVWVFAYSQWPNLSHHPEDVF